MLDQNLLWIGFIIFIVAMLALDLLVFNRKAHEIKPKEAILMWMFWVSLAVVFNVLVYIWYGSDKAFEFTTGYVMEEALSVDNMFVFVLVLAYFCVPKESHHKVLFYGVLGALIFRGIFIFAGITLVEQFSWIMYIFGAFLVITAVKMMMKKDDENVHPDKNIMVRAFRKHPDGHTIVRRIAGHRVHRYRFRHRFGPGNPRHHHGPFHRLHFQCLRHPGTEVVVLRPGERHLPVLLPEVWTGSDPGVRRCKDAVGGFRPYLHRSIAQHHRADPGDRDRGILRQEQGKEDLPTVMTDKIDRK
jgi:predicted tellurium resistance membrane protein TerC